MKNCDSFFSLFNNSYTGFPQNFPKFSKGEQCENKKVFDVFAGKLKSYQADKSKLKEKLQPKSLKIKLKYLFQKFFEYSDEQLSVIFSEEMFQSTIDFVRVARSFDPEMSFHDIFQATRNVWIMNGVQFLLGQKVELTPSIFAYSMLYPYTDNFLDNPLVCDSDKISFCDRFLKRLQGVDVVAVNDDELKIFRMVELIEENWNREKYPKVYESLIGIHDAQVNSVRLLNVSDELNSDDILKICIQKGGTSVVADGYLVLGNLKLEQEKFLYSYGAYLQLLDDLQDVGDDYNSSLMTYFSFSAQSQKLDELANMILNLGLKVVQQAKNMGTGQVDVFQSLMRKSIELFLVDSVLSNKQFYTRKYVRKIEEHSPFSLDFIRNQKRLQVNIQEKLTDDLMGLISGNEMNDTISFIQKKEPAY